MGLQINTDLEIGDIFYIFVNNAVTVVIISKIEVIVTSAPDERDSWYESLFYKWFYKKHNKPESKFNYSYNYYYHCHVEGNLGTVRVYKNKNSSYYISYGLRDRILYKTKEELLATL